jgi:MFS family permease
VPTRWLMLVILSLVRLAMSYQFQSVASVSSELVEEFGFSYAEVGTLIGFFLLPGLVFAIPVGLATRHTTDKSLLLLGAALMIAGGLIMGSAGGAVGLYVGRLVTGLGGTIFNVILTKMVTDWFFEKELVSAMAIVMSAWPCGIGLGLVSHGLIAANYGWSGVMHASAIVTALALLLAALAYRDAPVADTGRKQNLRLSLPRRQFAHTGVVGLAWTLFNVSFVVIISFSPDVLIDHGYDPMAARSATSLMMWVSMLAAPIGGRLTELTGRVTWWILGTLLVSCIPIVTISQGMLPTLSFIVLGILISIPVGAMVSLMSEAVSSENRGPGLGIFYTWFYAGMAIGPALAGWTRDQTGDPASPILLAASLLVVAVLLIGLLRLLQVIWPIEQTASSVQGD